MNKKFRLRKDGDFKKVIRKNQLRKNKTYIVYYDSNDLDHARYGISVSRKIAKAVVRNKIKRQIRVILNETKHFAKKMDFIIIVRNTFLNNCFDENKQQLSQIIESIRELSNE